MTKRSPSPLGRGLGAGRMLRAAREWRRCAATRLSRDRRRVLDNDPQVFGGLRCRCHHAHAVGRIELVPDALRHDRHHPAAERQALPALRGHQVQRRRAIDDLHDLVALRMPLPGASAGEFGGEDRAVAIGRQPGEGPLALGLGRRRGPQPAKLGAVGLGSARHLTEHVLASGLGQLAHQCVSALAARGGPRIAVFHTTIMQRSCTAEKPNLFSGIILLQIF